MYPQRSVMTCGLATALEPPHFNPRTRVGCDTMTSQFCRHFVRVSIHAPAWGATSLASHADASATAVSIHAPAWGATPSCRPSPAGIPCFNPRTRVGCDDLHRQGQSGVPPSFNPRTRVGCDQCPHTGLAFVWHVSIHAPAWGATISRFRVSAFAGCFNPRTRVGCDNSIRNDICIS